MSISENKITNWTNPIAGEVDKPQRTAPAMKDIFDSNSNDLKTAHNALIDALAGSGGSGEIGSDAAGIEGATVKAKLEALKTLTDRVKTDQGTTKYLRGDGSYAVPPANTAENGLPLGGNDGDILMKDGNENYAAEWKDPATHFSPADHNHDGTYAVPAQDKTATLTVAGWSAQAPYTQTVNVAGITAAMKPIVDIVLSGTQATAETELVDWGKVSKIETGAGSITATCFTAVPTVALNLTMKVVG